MKQGKVWGHTTQVMMSPFTEVHSLVINPHSHCSKHKHAYKYNLFYVISGELFVNVWKADQNLVDQTYLKAGEWTIVKPNEMHQFETDSAGCVCLEVYWPEGLNGPDIIRETVGGKSQPKVTKVSDTLYLRYPEEELDG